jgi:ABC-2 type transport system permease protein
MKQYLEVAKITFKSQLAYRFDVIFGTGLSFFRILLAFVLWGALFQNKQQIGGFTLPMMITYYIIMSFFRSFDTTDSMVRQFSSEIREGQFTKYLVKPMKPLWYFTISCYSKTAFVLGINLAVTCFYALLFQNYFLSQFNITSCISGIFIGLLGLNFMILLNYLIAVLSFKFLEIGAFHMIKDNILEFLTGALIPLALLPLWFQNGMRCLPFYYIYYLPAMLCMNREMERIPEALAVLIVWNILMILVVTLVYGVLRKEYEGAGL